MNTFNLVFIALILCIGINAEVSCNTTVVYSDGSAFFFDLSKLHQDMMVNWGLSSYMYLNVCQESTYCSPGAAICEQINYGYDPTYETIATLDQQIWGENPETDPGMGVDVAFGDSERNFTLRFFCDKHVDDVEFIDSKQDMVRFRSKYGCGDEYFSSSSLGPLDVSSLSQLNVVVVYSFFFPLLLLLLFIVHTKSH